MVQIPLTADTEITAFGRDLGSGTTFPASGPAGTSLRRGDVCFRTDYGGLFIWTGAAWRQRGPCELTNAQRLALVTAGLHVDFRVWETDKLREWLWTGTAWIPMLGEDWTLFPVVGAPYLIHNNLTTGLDAVPSGQPGTPGMQYRREGNRVFLRGIAFTNAAIAASTNGSVTLSGAALPAACIPAVAALLMVPYELGTTTSVIRLNLGTNGFLYPPKALNSGVYLFFDGLSYSLT